MMTGAFLSLNYSALSSFYYNAILLLNYADAILLLNYNVGVKILSVEK